MFIIGSDLLGDAGESVNSKRLIGVCIYILSRSLLYCVSTIVNKRDTFHTSQELSLTGVLETSYVGRQPCVLFFDTAGPTKPVTLLIDLCSKHFIFQYEQFIDISMLLFGAKFKTKQKQTLLM